MIGDFYLVPVFVYVLMMLFVVYKTGKIKAADDQEYFLADRSIGTFQSFLSVVATETSVATIVVFPAAGMKYGYSLLWLPAGYILGRYIVANYYLRKLYESPDLSIYSAISGKNFIVSKILSAFYLFAKFISNGVRLFLGAYALHQIFGFSIILWIFIMAAAAGLYSLSGGIKAVVMMDQIQGYIIYSFGFVFCIYLLWILPESAVYSSEIIDLNFSYSNAGNSLSLLLGGAVLSIGSHGSDQDMLQRVLAVKGFEQAKKSLFYSGIGAAVVIFIYLTAGYLVGLMNLSTVDTKSPLIDFIMKKEIHILVSLLAILIFAASSSTLDSSVNSTAVIWKSLFNSKLSGRFWSFLSLMLLTLFAWISIYLHKYSADFLGFAMGSMNYINGGLIGIITVYTFFSNRLTGVGILLGLIGGFAATAVSYWMIHPAVAWTWVVLISSGVSFLFAILPGFIFHNEAPEVKS